MKVDEESLRALIRTEMRAELDVFELKLDVKLEHKFATAYGQISYLLDEKLETAIRPLSDRIDKMYNTLDGFVARMDTDDAERAATNHQVDRHGRWIGELAKSTKTTLSAP
jgi:hypothetical protein